MIINTNNNVNSYKITDEQIELLKRIIEEKKQRINNKINQKLQNIDPQEYYNQRQKELQIKRNNIIHNLYELGITISFILIFTGIFTLALCYVILSI